MQIKPLPQTPRRVDISEWNDETEAFLRPMNGFEALVFNDYFVKFYRKDDAPETVRKRLQVYHSTTEVLKDFYGKLGRLRLVNGSQSIEGANADILKAIGAKV